MDSRLSRRREGEDEHTLSEVPPHFSPPTNPNSLQPRFPQSRRRLKLRRPQILKRRTSHTYIRDPLPLTEGLDPNDRWLRSPGPRPVPNNECWDQRQPLISPLHPAHPSSRTSRENIPVSNNGSSFERLVNELLPNSPSIQLSPPGSPTSQATKLPQEPHEQKHGVQKLSPSPPGPTSAPQQNRPKPAPWRTRLPPRPPIPKWDI